jgi:hypothetical protein
MSGITDQLNELMNEFAQDDVRMQKMEQFIQNCPEDKLEDLLKAVNPYGPVAAVKSGTEEMVSISYTNLRMEYAKRFAAVSLVAFMTRMLKEYKVPEEVPPVEPAEFIENPGLLDTPAHIKDPKVREKWAEARETMADRVTIWKFFQHIFQFDPDRHVAAALQTNKKDPAREKIPATKAVRTAVTAKKNAVRSAAVKRQDWEAGPEDLQPLDEDGKSIFANEVEQAAFETIPPHDMFAKWDRYAEEHYEQIQDATKKVYGCVPDVDFLVIAYDAHKTKEEAQKFKDTHMDRVIAPITQIRKNRWAILGPYRENRERVDFLNRHTEVLKEMIDQRERDSHVATDIMKKRIKAKKAENIKEAGPDDKAFRRYLRANKPAVAGLGGEHVNQGESSDDDCPEDAVEVNVFTVGEGGRELKVHKIYNPVEAPVVGDAPSPATDGERKSHEELVAGARATATVAELD